MSYVADLPASTKRLWRGGQLRGDTTTWSGTVWFVFDFADLTAFITVVAGTLETVWGNTQRVVTLRHPDYPNGLIAVNMEIDYTGVDADNDPPYGKCIARVDFESPQWPLVGSQAFMTITRNNTSEVVTIQGANLQIGGTPINQDAGVFVQTAEISVTQFFVPYDYSVLIDSLVNRVNNDVFLGKPAGTVLFATWQSAYQVTTTNTTAYQQTLNFQYRNPPWGYVCTPAGWQGPTTYGDGTPVYVPADLTALFPS